jgi:hypothetical protein
MFDLPLLQDITATRQLVAKNGSRQKQHVLDNNFNSLYRAINQQRCEYLSDLKSER